MIQKNADEVLVDKNEIGVKMAEDEKYAFFMESVSIEYEIQRHCRLTQIGGLLDEKHYAIAMRKGKCFPDIFDHQTTLNNYLGNSLI